MYGNITVTLSAADKAAIKQKVQDILAIILASGTTIINLTQEERRSLPKMGNKRYAFVKRLIQAVNEIRIPIMQMFEKVDDTMRGVGYEAYRSALQGKELFEAANRTNPGLDDMMNELQEFFDHAQQEEEGGGTPSPTPTPPTPAP